jgi:hypothetical protein
MKKLAWGFALLVAVIGIVGYLNRDLIAMMLAFGRMKPEHSFAQDQQAAAPDYSGPDAWAALPDRADAADVVLAGATDVQATASVDVFFVHPTTYYRPDHWNQRLDDAATNQLTDEFVLKNQASVFNGCCRVFAPRYRQATVYSFLDQGQDGPAALALAYEDVERAFDHFIRDMNGDRPFIIAGHSQGSTHIRKLLARRVTGSPLIERLVAVYPVGFAFDGQAYAKDVPDIPVCAGETQTRCLVTWNTVGPEVREFQDTSRNICVNPLTWKVDGERADFALNLGAVTFNQRFESKSAVAEDATFKPQVEVGAADAQCVNGNLVVTEIRSDRFGARPMGRDNYHIYDFSLFHMNIRRNAQARVEAFVAAHSVAPASANVTPANAGALPDGFPRSRE